MSHLNLLSAIPLSLYGLLTDPGMAPEAPQSSSWPLRNYQIAATTLCLAKTSYIYICKGRHRMDRQAHRDPRP